VGKSFAQPLNLGHSTVAAMREALAEHAAVVKFQTLSDLSAPPWQMLLTIPSNQTGGQAPLTPAQTEVLAGAFLGGNFNAVVPSAAQYPNAVSAGPVRHGVDAWKESGFPLLSPVEEAWLGNNGRQLSPGDGWGAPIAWDDYPLIMSSDVGPNLAGPALQTGFGKVGIPARSTGNAWLDSPSESRRTTLSADDGALFAKLAVFLAGCGIAICSREPAQSDADPSLPPRNRDRQEEA
jgi:hypothetical protein